LDQPPVEGCGQPGGADGGPAGGDQPWGAGQPGGGALGHTGGRDPLASGSAISTTITASAECLRTGERQARATRGKTGRRRAGQESAGRSGKRWQVREAPRRRHHFLGCIYGGPRGADSQSDGVGRPAGKEVDMVLLHQFDAGVEVPRLLDSVDDRLAQLPVQARHCREEQVPRGRARRLQPALASLDGASLRLADVDVEAPEGLVRLSQDSQARFLPRAHGDRRPYFGHHQFDEIFWQLDGVFGHALRLGRAQRPSGRLSGTRR